MRRLLYGSLALLSEICKDCGQESFVINGKFACCGKPAGDKPSSWKRMSITGKRHQFTPAFVAELVDAQNGLCFWCGIAFAKDEWRNGRKVDKAIHVEHIEPFIYSGDDEEQNTVASDSICNHIKACLMFPDIYECREYIKVRRAIKGYTAIRPDIALSELREEISTNAPGATLLQQ